MREKMPKCNIKMEAFTTFVQQELSRGLKSVAPRPPNNALARVSPPKQFACISEDVNRDS